MCRQYLVFNITSLLIVGLIAGCDGKATSKAAETSATYSATIERTQYGTAHITADDWGSLGFGQGYAFAQDRFCLLADQIVKVRSQRARYFGPGNSDEHIKTDIAYRALGLVEKAPKLIAAMSNDGRAMLHGYVAGYNQYLAETGIANLPKECAGQEWVQPIDAESLMAYSLDIATLHGSRGWLEQIATAQPPSEQKITSFSNGGRKMFGGGSNAVAFGSQMTANGRGLLLANPHLSWEGELKFHEVHLTIPGEVDVAGVSFAGLFGVANGFNESTAWTFTDSTAHEFIVYRLDLVPGLATRYYFGNEQRDMEARTYSISVLQPDGSLSQEDHTLYYSHYGPMLAPIYGREWTTEHAYAIFDPNLDNGALVDTGLELNRADSVLEIREVFRNFSAVPWNITAVDSDGRAFYADGTLVPKLSDTAEAAFRSLVESDQPSDAKVLFRLPFALGFVLLDGSDPLNSVQIDPEATHPGIIPFKDAPQLLRADFVANSNDSYWLTNPAAPLSGYSLRYGEIETARRLRTRMGLTQILESPQWTRLQLQDMQFANRSQTEELWRNLFAQYCSQFSTATASDGRVVNVDTACNVLASWDGRYDINSRGAILFRELMTSVDLTGNLGGQSFFSVGFDAQQPVLTPNGLTEAGNSYLLTQLADVVLRLEKVGISIDAPLGDHQFTLKGNDRIPIHGGLSMPDGAFNVVDYNSIEMTLLPRLPSADLVNFFTKLTTDGYLINAGASFIMTVEFTENGPVADAILSYSQSDDSSSEHFADQTFLYRDKEWRPLPFTRAQIEEDPALTSIQVSN